MTGIYKVTNKENGLIYIGKAKDIYTDEEVKYFRQQVKNGKSIKSLHEKECNVKCCYAAFYNMVKGKTYKNVL